MAYWILFVLTAVVSSHARLFNNPILSDRSYQQPGAIKVNGTYYVVSRISDTSKGIFAVQTSTDLIDWREEGYLFDETNTPKWTDKTTFGAPSIHQMRLNYLLYFQAYNTTNLNFHIGVAQAPHPLGPYSSIDRPIVSTLRNDTVHPSVINDNEKLYLVWSTYYTISARQLNANGLSFSSAQTTTLLKPTLSWEGSKLYYPWYVKKGSYHYLFYTGADYCNGSIGVARSTNILGPYEKLANPILVSNSTYSCTQDTVILKDLDDASDVIFLNSDISNYSFAVVLASLGWNADDWPYIGQL